MRLIKYIFMFVGFIVFLCVITVVCLVILLTGGKNFTVDKTSEDIQSVISTSIYESFDSVEDETLKIKLDEDDLNRILNQIIIDTINADYETKNSIYEVNSNVKVEKAKIFIKDNKVKIVARTKAYKLHSNFSATGTLSFDAGTEGEYPKLKIKLTKAKLGRLTIKNPSKYLKNVESEYIENGLITLPLEIDNGFMDILLDNCNPTISIDEALILSIDLSKVINEEEKNTVYSSYNEGDMAAHSLSGVTLASTEIRISADDFNGYMMVEDYDDFGISTTVQIIEHSYTLSSWNIYLDTIDSKLYYGIDFQGIKSYIILSYEIESSSEAVTFNVSGLSLNEIDGDIQSLLSNVTATNSFVISYDTLEEAFNNKINISNVTIDTTTGEFVIACQVLSL